MLAVESSGIICQIWVSLSVCRRTHGSGWAVATRGLAWSVAVSEPPQPPGLICDKKNMLAALMMMMVMVIYNMYIPGSTWYVYMCTNNNNNNAERGRSM